jgi:hypothetical protein
MSASVNYSKKLPDLSKLQVPPRNKRPGFTLDRHKALGLELQAMRDSLTAINVVMKEVYPHDIQILPEQALSQLDTLRASLTAKVFAEHPHLDHQVLNQVYSVVDRPGYKASHFADNFRPFALCLANAEKGLSFTSHDALGLELNTMRDNLGVIWCELGRAYPRKISRRLQCLTDRIQAHVDSLRWVLDDIVCREYPRATDAVRVYSCRSSRPGFILPAFQRDFPLGRPCQATRNQRPGVTV